MKRPHHFIDAGSLLVAVRLRPDAGAVARARAALDRLHLLRRYPERAFDLRLLVSELVSNAVKHGDADASILLTVERIDTTLRVTVANPGPLLLPARVECPPPDATSGRGLYLLTALADRWGVDRREGARAWFELDLAAPPSSPSPGAGP